MQHWHRCWSLCSVFVYLCICINSSYASLSDPVTCGSTIKLMSVTKEARLHSHDVKYGSGSGQQSVTAVPDSDDNNSHWSLLGKTGEHCQRGKPIECGQQIRLLHLTTGCLLHSHLFPSPLSNNQEVSCFGNEGKGDSGDHWEVQCSDDFWFRKSDVRLKHVDTAKYLAVVGQKYGRPIAGQYEVSATSSISSSNNFQTAEGVFIMPDEDQ